MKTRAHRRYLGACVALARVRRLLYPMVAQINVAQPGAQQVNMATPGGASGASASALNSPQINE